MKHPRYFLSLVLVFVTMVMAFGQKSTNPLSCENGIIQNSKSTKHKITEYTRLLSFTPEKLINYYKSRPYLEILAGLEQKDGLYFLNLIAKFESKDIKKSYGSINEKDFLRVTFLDGRHVFLRNLSISEAKLESLTGKTIYEAKFSIHKDDILLLESLLIDEIGILWSSGFESYPVAYVEFLNHHFQCLKK